MKYATFLLFFLSAFAFAGLPSPKDVDREYNAGNYQTAEKMLVAVMREHPSAKAHFRLGEVYSRENRHAEALSEFSQAKTLDPSLAFVKSPGIFNQLVNTEQMYLSNNIVRQQVVAQPQVIAQQPVQQKPSTLLAMIVVVVS